MIKLNFNKKIIIFFSVIILILGFVFLTIQNNKNNDFTINTNDENNFISAENTVEKNNKTVDNEKEKIIYVHIIGEVVNPGLVKLNERR